jgi:hypothetical protein
MSSNIASEPNLKRKNLLGLWAFFLFNTSIYISVFYQTAFDAMTTIKVEGVGLRVLGISVGPLVMFVVNGLLTSNQKATLVFWRLKLQLPGHRAFSKHLKGDSRINITALRSKYGTLPRNPIDQNRLWYKIYRKHSGEVPVVASHKHFLLARDLTSLSFLFLLVTFVSALTLGIIQVQWVLVGFMFLQYLVLSHIARNYGHSFVKNVLAIDSID